MTPKYSILMVCTGNICRSVMAQHVLQQALNEAGLSDEVHVDSCGISDEEYGNPPDRRAVKVLNEHGYGTPYHHARQIEADDFETFDLILTMTSNHLRSAKRLEKYLAKSQDRHQAKHLAKHQDKRQDKHLAYTDEQQQGKGNQETAADIRLYRSFDDVEGDVPDPWYGTYADFEYTLEVVSRVTPRILSYIQERIENS